MVAARQCSPDASKLVIQRWVRARFAILGLVTL
jgi:hypothetical protein